MLRVRLLGGVLAATLLGAALWGGRSGWAKGTDPWSGKVIQIIDGDALVIRQDPQGLQVTVRLWGVDAPEAKQPFGPQAARWLSRAVMGKTVRVQPVAPGSRERLTARVFWGQGRSLSQGLVQAGLAWCSPKALSAQKASANRKTRASTKNPGSRKGCAQAQARAQAQKRGLWSAGRPQPPWRWRQHHKTRDPLRAQAQAQPRVPAQKRAQNPIQTRRPGQIKAQAGACYKTCLEQNMARAEAWEAIQANCRWSCRQPPRATGTNSNKPQAPHPSSPDLACQRDTDCVFSPRDNCGCDPCGPTRRRAVNRAHAAWLLREYAREQCPRQKCPPCTKPVTWLGSKAACRQGACVVLP